MILQYYCYAADGTVVTPIPAAKPVKEQATTVLRMQTNNAVYTVVYRSAGGGCITVQYSSTAAVQILARRKETLDEASWRADAGPACATVQLHYVRPGAHRPLFSGHRTTIAHPPSGIPRTTSHIPHRTTSHVA